MAHFLTVIALDLTKLTRYPIWTLVFMMFFWMRLTKFGNIHSGGWDRTFLLSPVISAAIFLFFPPCFWKRLGVIRMLLIYWFRTPDLGFFCLEVFYWLGLDKNVGRRGVHWLAAIVALWVEVLASGSLYLSLGLSLDSLFDQIIPIVQILAFFINQ